MTLLERLQSHKGGLLRLKTQLFWYDGRGWDKNPGRICLILDAATSHTTGAVLLRAATPIGPRAAHVVALLLIDGSPQWIWMAVEDVEVIDETG